MNAAPAVMAVIFGLMLLGCVLMESIWGIQ